MNRLTIGLPVYNAMPYLEESLNSLLCQTDSNFTILAIDDGSTDSSFKYLRSVKDPRLTAVHQANRGLTYTLNRMLREVETPWLMRHDADDVAAPTRVALTRSYIDRHPDAGLFYAEARYYQEGRSVGTFRTTRAKPEELREITAGGYLPAICHPTVTLNVKKALALGGYRFDLHIEDIDLWWRMALKYELHYIPEVTTYFRHNEASVSAANLENQSINTLYVQYLLLSQLHGLRPLAYDAVLPKLARLIDQPKLTFREQMRRANICFSRKDYTHACDHLVRAMMASPSYFARRVLYEIRGGKAAFNGENPAIFLHQSQALWPELVEVVTPTKSSGLLSSEEKGAECA